MILSVYSIFDAAVGTFARPFFMANNGQAMRAFDDEVNNVDSTINKHPEHFSLYLLGTYDDKTGMFTQDAEPKHIVRAIDFHKPAEVSNKEEAKAQIQLLKEILAKVS